MGTCPGHVTPGGVSFLGPGLAVSLVLVLLATPCTSQCAWGQVPSHLGVLDSLSEKKVGVEGAGRIAAVHTGKHKNGYTVSAPPWPVVAGRKVGKGPSAPELGCRNSQASLPTCACRHLLNVTWEGRDFSFSPGGYLVQPTMVVIALNRHRLWEMVRRG